MLLGNREIGDWVMLRNKRWFKVVKQHKNETEVSQIGKFRTLKFPSDTPVIKVKK